MTYDDAGQDKYAAIAKANVKRTTTNNDSLVYCKTKKKKRSSNYQRRRWDTTTDEHWAAERETERERIMIFYLVCPKFKIHIRTVPHCDWIVTVKPNELRWEYLSSLHYVCDTEALCRVGSLTTCVKYYSIQRHHIHVDLPILYILLHSNVALIFINTRFRSLIHTHAHATDLEQKKHFFLSKTIAFTSLTDEYSLISNSRTAVRPTQIIHICAFVSWCRSVPITRCCAHILFVNKNTKIRWNDVPTSICVIATTIRISVDRIQMEIHRLSHVMPINRCNFVRGLVHRWGIRRTAGVHTHTHTSVPIASISHRQSLTQSRQHTNTPGVRDTDTEFIKRKN